MLISNAIPELDATANVQNVKKEATSAVQSECRRKWNEMSHCEIGDRVEIVDEIGTQSPSKIGVIIATEGAFFPGKFRVRLADGTESVFWDSQLHVPPVIFADMIYDTHVSPVPPGLRGSTSEHHMRFISREFDIHLKLTESDKQNSLYGQVRANGVAPESSLITLLFNGEPHATTVTDTGGEFKLDQIPSGNAMLEILVPSRRIVATFDVSPA